MATDRGQHTFMAEMSDRQTDKNDPVSEQAEGLV